MSSLTEGLVGHWKFDESYGTSFSDVSGYNNSGTYYGETFNNGTIYGASWTEGKYGSALYFDGENDYIDCGNDTSLQNYTAKTVLVWIKIPSGKYAKGYILDDGYWLEPYGDIIYGYPDSHHITIYLKNTDGETISWYKMFEYTPNAWTQIGYTWDGTHAWYIKNGVKYEQKDFSGTLGCSAQNLIIGFHGSAYFNGLIDEVRIYNKALSEEEIQSIYQNNTFIRDGLKAYWRFDEGTGDTAYDTHHIAYSTNSGGSRYGNALSFDGVDDYIQVPDNSTLEPSQITVSAWIKVNKIDANQDIVAKRYSSPTGSYTSYRLVIRSSGTFEFWVVNTDGVRDVASTSAIANEWIHLVGVYDGFDIKIYVNGELKDTESLTGDIRYDDNPLRIASLDGTNCMFDGLIDDVRIYNRALTETEIRGLYNLYGAGSAKLIYSGSSYFYFYPTRWDEDNWSVVVETFLTDVHRDLLFANVVPGAVAELYNILGRPKYIDTTYNSGNTLIIVPYLSSISGLRKTRRIAVKSISDTFINPSTYRVKIEGLRLDTED